MAFNLDDLRKIVEGVGALQEDNKALLAQLNDVQGELDMAQLDIACLLEEEAKLRALIEKLQHQLKFKEEEIINLRQVNEAHQVQMQEIQEENNQLKDDNNAYLEALRVLGCAKQEVMNNLQELQNLFNKFI